MKVGKPAKNIIGELEPQQDGEKVILVGDNTKSYNLEKPLPLQSWIMALIFERALLRSS